LMKLNNKQKMIHRDNVRSILFSFHLR